MTSKGDGANCFVARPLTTTTLVVALSMDSDSSSHQVSAIGIDRRHDNVVEIRAWAGTLDNTPLFETRHAHYRAVCAWLGDWHLPVRNVAAGHRTSHAPASAGSFLHLLAIIAPTLRQFGLEGFNVQGACPGLVDLLPLKPPSLVLTVVR